MRYFNAVPQAFPYCEFSPSWAFALSSARFYAQEVNIVGVNLDNLEKKQNILNLTDKFHFCVDH